MTQPRKPAFVFFVPSNDRAAIKIDERENGVERCSRKMLHAFGMRIGLNFGFGQLKISIFISVLKENGEDEKRASE